MSNALRPIVVVAEDSKNLQSVLEIYRGKGHEVKEINDNKGAVNILLSNIAKKALWLISLTFPMELGKSSISSNQGGALVDDVLRLQGNKTTQIICLQGNPDEFAKFGNGKTRGPNVVKILVNNLDELTETIAEKLS